jgi:K+-transporting ATPase KdpF subunit
MNHDGSVIYLADAAVFFPVRRIGKILRQIGRIMEIAIGIAGIFLIVYLFVTIFKPERF